MFQRLGRARAVQVAAAAAAVLVTVAVASCGSERPASDPGFGDQPGAGLCATPNDGCECLEPGKLVECGQVKATSEDGYVACSMGHRQCVGGRWGACIGETDVVRPKTFTASTTTGIGTRALGTGAPCGSPGGGPANPCDPYCNAFVDDPIGLVLDGGLVVSDGGLTIPPTTDGGAAGAPGTFVSTPGGISNCGGANNLVAASCTPNTAAALTQCQQDFHCDPTTSRCLWNGGPGYYDPTVPGVDLTVGAPCGPSGSGAATAPVCNRGSGTLPAGATITLHVTAPSPVPNGCANLGPPTFTFTTTGPLGPGACTSFNLGNSTGNKFVVVNAGSPGAVVEEPGRCANNAAAYKDDGAPGCGTCEACNTRVSGTVYDPTGAGAGTNNLPLPGIRVYQPSGALKPLPDGVTCDTCSSLDSPAQAITVTDATGRFTLNNVSPGAAVPIVVQSGRWRRLVTVNVPAACENNTYGAGTFRMPRNRTEGNIPKMAVVTGQLESLACLLRKMGVDATDIGGSTGAGDPKRVEIFRFNGMNTSPAAPAASTLWTAANISRFTAVIADCPSEGNNPVPNAADRAAVRSFVDAGGRIFVDHWAGDYLLDSAEFPTTSTWNSTFGTGAFPALPARGRVVTGAIPAQTLLRDWLATPAVNASSDYGTNWIRIDEARANARQPVSGVVNWIGGRMSNDWGAGAPPGNPSNPQNYSLSYSFDTPFPGGNCGAAGGTGRVIYNGMHVNPSRGTTGTFPGSCNLGLALAPEEKALEYQLFQLTACALGGGSTPPPPAPPPPLVSVGYQRDYNAVCRVGERVKWGPFYWQAIVPPGTNIDVRAATADTAAALPASPPVPPAPTTAQVARATLTTLPPAWDCTGCPGAPVTVDAQLRAETGTPSKNYLRVYMTFNPTPLVPPTLLAWRQIYDCVPAE